MIKRNLQSFAFAIHKFRPAISKAVITSLHSIVKASGPATKKGEILAKVKFYIHVKVGRIGSLYFTLDITHK